MAEIERTSLAGKRVLLTGGTTGIGRAAVRQLAAAGARVLTFGRHEPELQAVLAEVAGSAGEVIGQKADVTSPGDLDRIFAEADDRLGGIDILICNAALGAAPIHEMPERDWRYVVETNLVGYLACAQAALERMRGRGGHILFVSSISVEIKAEGESVYSATKAGIQAFAETLRKEIAEDNVKISVIQPGSVRTDMQECSEDEKREAVANDEMLEPEEVADASLFVLTRSARADVLNLRIEPRIQKTS